MPTKYPNYTRIFTDVYLKELDYIVKRRDQMKFTYDEVEKESQRFRDKLLEKPESIKEIPNESQTGILDKFSGWFLVVGLLGLLAITTLWFSINLDSEVSKWAGISIIFIAWSSWILFLKLKFQGLFLGTTETPKSSHLNIKPSTKAGLVGLALSGGGVRSATFNLGLLQSLAKNKVLQYCDYLSTVSGGGYIGSCLTSLLTSDSTSTKTSEFPLRDEPDGELEERAEVNYLRKTKNYLGVGGFFNQDTWHMIGTLFSSIMLTITIPLAIILLMILMLYGYNNLPLETQTSIGNGIRFLIIALFLWMVVIRLRQVIFSPLIGSIIWLDGVLFLTIVFFGLLVVISPIMSYFSVNEDFFYVFSLSMAFLVTFLFWWAEIINQPLIKRVAKKTNQVITILLESLVVVGLFIIIPISLLIFGFDQDVLLVLGIFGGIAFLLVLVLRNWMPKWKSFQQQQVDNLLELDKRIARRAILVGSLFLLISLLSLIQYLTQSFIENRVIPERIVYVTTPYLLVAFILTLIVGYLLANQANKLLKKSIKMVTAIISILLIFTFSASLLADILLQRKIFVEAREVVNTLYLGIVESENSYPEIFQKLNLQKPLSIQLRDKLYQEHSRIFDEIKISPFSDLKKLTIALEDLQEQERKHQSEIKETSNHKIKEIDDILQVIKLIEKREQLRQGWEKLKHLLVLKGKTRVQEITKRIYQANETQSQNNQTELPEIEPKFFQVGNLPKWEPLHKKCDINEVKLLIQLKEKVEAEKNWQIQRAKTLSFDQASIPGLTDILTMDSNPDDLSKLFSPDELDRWLEAVYTIAFYQGGHLDLERDVLKKLNNLNDELKNIKKKLTKSDNHKEDNNWKLSGIVLVVVMVLMLLGLITNINRNSLHEFYRSRLSRTYIIKREDNSQDEPIKQMPSLLLKDIHQLCNGPYHLVNTTLNVPTSENALLQGRGADFFVFSKYYCGSESTGYRSTEKYYEGQCELSTAMAISGAAASPEMGTSTNPIIAFWMTMLNVRLNQWMLNPNLIQKPKLIIWPFYLAKEFFRLGKPQDTLLNLSDGGHHENLGIYPLLKRRCKVIIASDAGADPKFEMADLANLQRKARIDLGINIELDLSDLRPNSENQGYTKTYFVKGTIRYPNDETGTLFYIKTTVTGDEPEDLLAYRRTHPTFPDETTADQFFNEDQFESYRKLGELAGERVCSKEHHTVDSEIKVSLAKYIEKDCGCQETHQQK